MKKFKNIILLIFVCLLMLIAVFSIINSKQMISNANLVKNQNTTLNFNTKKQLVDNYGLTLDLVTTDSSMIVSYFTKMPFIFKDTTYFENNLLTNLQVYVGEVTDNETYQLTLKKIKSDTVYEGNIPTVLDSYVISITGNMLTPNSWNDIDISTYNIYVDSGQTLGFGDVNDTLPFYFYNASINGNINYYYGNKADNDFKLSLRNGRILLFGVQGISSIENTKSKQLIPNYDVLSTISTSNTNVTKINALGEPFIYEDTSLFENNKLTKLQIIVADIESSAKYKFTLSVIDSSTVKANAVPKILRGYVIDIDGSTLVSNSWNEIDLTDYNIFINEGETIGFGNRVDTLPHYFYKTVLSNNYPYFGNNNVNIPDFSLKLRKTFNLMFGVEGIMNQAVYNENQENIKSQIAKEKKLKDVLANKNVSILAASIGTHEGYSSNINYNATIGSNVVYYNQNRIRSVDDTWWKQVIDTYDMNLVVNNSWSGSQVLDSNFEKAGYNTRPMQLHNNQGVNPDIVFVYLGLNDHRVGTEVGVLDENLYAEVEEKVDNNDTSVPKSFVAGYIEMIYKIKKTYGDVDIFVWLVPDRNVNNELLEEYNTAIKSIITHYDGYYFDLTSHELMSGINYNAYTVGDNVHPNEIGMDIMSNIMVETLEKAYVKEIVVPDDEESDNNSNNDNEENEDVENPYTSTNMVRIITVAIIIITCIVLYLCTKQTKVNKYE